MAYNKTDILLKRVFAGAKRKDFALGAFNVCNLETIKAVINAAQNLSSAVIVESSPGETKFIGLKQLSALVKTYGEQTRLPIFLNLDHATSLEACKEAIGAGFDLVHFDGSNLLPEENIRICQDIVKYAHSQGVLVEGEIDKIPETSIPHQETAEKAGKGLVLTDPECAAEFVEKTGVDVLAVFVGNLHGTYTTPPTLDFERLSKIRGEVDCFLSLHGGSGIADEDIKKAIKVGGVVKINVNTELRIAYRKALEEALKKSASVKVYEVMPEVIGAVQRVVEKKIRLFGLEDA